MVRAVRVISVEKGEDPRDFSLMAFGGAGALHASQVAKQLGIRTVCIPPAPGLLCSMGALMAVPTMEYSRSRVLASSRWADVRDIFSVLKAEANQWLVHEGVEAAARCLRCSVDMRYVGQNYELTIPLDGEQIGPDELARAVDDFHTEHGKEFGYASPADAVQVVTCRVVATAAGSRLESPPIPPQHTPPSPRAVRSTYFETTGAWLECPVYWRDDLGAGATFQGPTIIEQLDATTVLYPDDAAVIDDSGNILITVGQASEEVRSHA
jgi:N-methylhydantoinase A